MRIIKVLIIIAVGALSLLAAIHFTGNYVAEVSSKDKTLAEVIIQNQLEAELNKAEEQAKEELGEVLVTTSLETKPVTTTTTSMTTTVTTTITTSATTTTTTTTSTTITTPVKSDITTTTTPAEEEIVTEFTRGGILPSDRSGISFKTIFTLTESEQQRLTQFLIEHYFLNGDIYVANESRASLREKKRIANNMEKSAIAALNLVLEKVDMSDIASVLEADYTGVISEIRNIRSDFEKNYKDADKYGEQFGRFYNDGIAFLDRLLLATEKLQKSAKEYSESTNAFFAALVLAKAVEEVIVPEITAVLEQSFDLVEISQDIFLEGTKGTRLLSRDEVSEIIGNPALVLDTGLA